MDDEKLDEPRSQETSSAPAPPPSRARTVKPRMRRAEDEGARRWREQMERLGLPPLRPLPHGGVIQMLETILTRLDAMEAQHVHLHADLVALREVERIPRPECYPEPPKPKRRAERAQEEQP